MSFEALHVIGHLWFWVLLGSSLFLALYSWQFGLDDAHDDPASINEKADFSTDTGTEGGGGGGSSSQRHKIRRSQQRMLKSQHQQQQQQNNTFRTGDFLFGVLPNAALIKWREIDRK
jgi:hypothetical protein